MIINTSLFSFNRRAFPSLGGGGKREPLPRSATHTKKPKKQNYVVITPKETYTHDFCLLSSKHSTKTPSLMELTKLREAGLGKCKITFDNKRSGHGKVRQVLETIYPKLKCQNGAFEILRAERGGTSCKLVLIEMSQDGYTVPYLREQVSCNTILHIGPMQNDLSMSKVIMKTDDSIKTKCQNCSREVPLGDMKTHLAQCTEGESTASRASIPHSYCEDSSDDDCLVTGIEENCPSSSSAPIDDKAPWHRELSILFPFHTAGQIEVSVVGASSVDEAANNLMETYNPDPKAAESHSKERAVTDLPTLLREFQGYHMKFGIEELCIDRDAVWADTL